MITHLEPDILECEVKWALGSITMNKASGGDGIPVERFKSWKMMLWKCCTQYVSKFGKLSSGHKTGKYQLSFQFQRKVPGASTGDPTRDKVMQRGLMGKASQVSRGPLSEHLPWNQNLSVYCLLYYTLLTLQGTISDHLSLEKVNLELQLVSCIWKESYTHLNAEFQRIG